MYSEMRTPWWRILLKKGNSSQFWNGSAHVTPFVLQKCAGGCVDVALGDAPAPFTVTIPATMTAAAAIPRILFMPETSPSPRLGGTDSTPFPATPQIERAPESAERRIDRPAAHRAASRPEGQL